MPQDHRVQIREVDVNEVEQGQKGSGVCPVGSAPGFCGATPMGVLSFGDVRDGRSSFSVASEVGVPAPPTAPFVCTTLVQVGL